jgi:hypothetical protein
MPIAKKPFIVFDIERVSKQRAGEQRRSPNFVMGRAANMSYYHNFFSASMMLVHSLLVFAAALCRGNPFEFWLS